jgi:hypothetical protein
MNTSIVAGSLLVALSLASPLGAQVAADVAVRSGPVAGRVVVGDGYSTYRRPVEYRRVMPARVIVVERVYVRHHRLAGHWRRQGFRPVVLYYRDGRYYDRSVYGSPMMRQVVVYEWNGRFYQECDERDWHDRYEGPRRYADRERSDRDWDHRDWND